MVLMAAMPGLIVVLALACTPESTPAPPTTASATPNLTPTATPSPTSTETPTGTQAAMLIPTSTPNVAEATPAQSTQTAAQKVAYVVEAQGGWLLNNKPVRAGETLYAGGVITNTSPSEDDHITIADLAGKPIDSRTCKSSSQCSQPINLPRPAKVGYFEMARQTVHWVMATLFSKPELVTVPGGARGITSLPDQVVHLDSGRIDLSSIFKQKDADRYYLELVPLGRAAQGKARRPIIFDWNPDKPSASMVSGISTGLYELTLLAPDGDEYKPTNDTSWILVTTGRDYEQMNRAFQDMAALTESWGSRVKPETKQSFLHASLSYLRSRQSR